LCLPTYCQYVLVQFSKTLKVTNIHREIAEARLKNTFLDFGELVHFDPKLPTNPKQKNYPAFIEFKSLGEAKEAAQQLQGALIPLPPNRASPPCR
jgi:RNA recognition motif-containing protein